MAWSLIVIGLVARRQADLMTRNDLELPQLPRLGSLRVGVHHGAPAPMVKGMREEQWELGRMVIPAFQVPAGGISWSALRERALAITPQSDTPGTAKSRSVGCGGT